MSGQMKLIPNGASRTVSDDGAGDLDGTNNGTINFRGNGPGMYQYCEAVAPTGY
jgi:hypothetical protein